MAPALQVRRQIVTTIKKFKFEELESMVIPHFPETSWNEVRLRLVQHHDSFTSTSVTRIIEQIINDKKIRDKELKKRLTLLEAVEISKHSKRRIWYGYELKDKKEEISSSISLAELRERMIQIFNTMKINMEVELVMNEGIIFVSIRDKKSLRVMPVFFALFLEKNYFFTTKKILTKEFQHVITESTGFRESKKLKLMGKHLKSLMKMLQMKKQGAAHAGKLYNSLAYKEAPPVIKNTGIDFRQHRQRKEHIEQIFGDDQPTIDVLSVKYTDMLWADKDIAALLPNVRLNMEWEFKSHDIFGFLGDLAEKRVLTHPLPSYVTKSLECGKNELKLKHP